MSVENGVGFIKVARLLTEPTTKNFIKVKQTSSTNIKNYINVKVVATGATKNYVNVLEVDYESPKDYLLVNVINPV